MADSGQVQLAPVAGKARIDVLDVLRGIAILGIFFMNIPFMGVSIPTVFVDVTRLGWSPADQASWMAVQVVLEGTQRGLLELLFGAGMMVLAARSFSKDAPIAIADLYWRRNLWLLGFGLVDIFLLLWAGDILHVYALAALFLFPFRKLGPKLLLTLGLIYAAYVGVTGTIRYVERAGLIQRVEVVQQKQAARAPLTAADKKTLDQWKKAVEDRKGGQGMQLAARKEPASRTGLPGYAMWNIGSYIGFVYPSLLPSVCEALCMMFIGVALWKWGVIQGGRSIGFYLALTLACYAIAAPLRHLAATEMIPLVPMARTGGFTYEIARMLMSIGHVGLVNLLMKLAFGRALLAPFKAAGRTAFSLYFMQQIIGLWILFAPWGFGPALWNKLPWHQLYLVAIAVLVFQLIIANLWVRWFTNGPLEWVWRSLSYLKWQPLRRREPLPGPTDATAMAT